MYNFQRICPSSSFLDGSFNTTVIITETRCRISERNQNKSILLPDISSVSKFYFLFYYKNPAGKRISIAKVCIRMENFGTKTFSSKEYERRYIG